MDRLAGAASEAASAPETWVPLAGAALLGATGWDDDISDWAAENTPVYGSQSKAAKASDYLQDGLVAGMAASSVFVPTGDDSWTFPTERVTANALAFGSANAVVAGLKETVRRDRPDGSDHRSFPSGHAAAAFTSASLIEQNLNQDIDDPWARASIKAGAFGLAAATGWARVEADKHYPADVLASAAISNFFARFFYGALVNDEEAGPPPLSFEAARDGLAFRFSRSF
jgi:hypothetical protein